MALPEAIQRELEAAEQIEQQLAAQAQQAGAPAAAEVPNEPQQEAEPQGDVASAAPEASEPLWETKYRTLQSKYDAEVPRLHSQLRDMQEQAARMAGEIEQMKRKPAEPEPANAPLVDEKDVETFGADLVDMASRAARQELAKANAEWEALLAKRDEYIARLEQKLNIVTERQGASDGKDFFSALTSAVPQWEQLQGTELGQQFLLSRVPGAVYTWDAVLKQAAQDLDVERAVEVFTEMVARNPQLSPSRPTKTAKELERQVAPSKSKPSAPAEGKRMWSQNEWTEAWESISRRHVTGKEAEALQAELDAAYAEGRIV